ncbi:MAG: YfhO family protein [Bacteroidota bacterium]|nr:YfhO family protein [Bacteroidota bacterium]
MAKAKRNIQPTTQKQLTKNWFDNLSDLKKDLISVSVIFILILMLFNQIIFKNMIFSESGDTAAAQAWAKAGEHLEQTEGQKPLWFPYIFSGMPGLGPLASIPYNVSYLQSVVHFIGKLLFLNGDMSWFVLHYFLAGILMFLLARTWHFSHIPSLLAAIVFMLSPYAVGLAGEGHGSKMMALSYIPLMLLLTYHLFEKRNLLSLGLLSVAIGTSLLTNHVQMVYYGFMLIGLFFVYEFIFNFKTQKLMMGKTTVFFFITLILGFAIASYVYLSTYEYSQYSIRGGGEAGTPGGLNYDYATNWSFHPFEIINLLIPSFFGFSSPYYWGWMPFTNSTVYFGVVPIILSIIALIYKRNKGTIFFALFAVLLFLISFGKHFPFYDLLFNYLPFFNKFRAPTMILHLLPLVFGMLAAYGLTFFIELPAKFDTAKMRKGLYVTMGIIATILVIGFIGKSTIYTTLSGSMFVKDGDMQQLQQQYAAQAPQVLQQLKEIRFDMLWKDYIKFAIIALVSLGLIVLYLNNKIKSTIMGLALILILIIDLFIIDTKYVDPKPKSAAEQHFAPDQAVQFLKQDKSQFRIFPLGQLFMDNTWMYHTIESIGGYSPAKIKIYQEMIDSCLYNGADPTFPINMNIVNMLNTKYLIFQGRLPEDKFTIAAYDQNKQTATYLNPAYQPRAFFVNEAIVAKNKTEVFKILNSSEFDSRIKAVLEKQPSSLPVKSDSVHINTLNYKTNLIELSTYCNNTSLLFLSEVYYPAGWKAYIDGKETEIYKTNYVLRSVVVPAGEHKIEFIFDPGIYKTGFIISHVGWGVSILLILIGLFSKKERKK